MTASLAVGHRRDPILDTPTVEAPQASLVRRDEGTDLTTIVLLGDIGILQEPTLTLALADAVARPAACTVIDCCGCGFLSGRSIEDILDAADSLRRLGGRLQVRGASIATRRALELLGGAHLLRQTRAD